MMTIPVCAAHGMRVRWLLPAIVAAGLIPGCSGARDAAPESEPARRRQFEAAAPSADPAAYARPRVLTVNQETITVSDILDDLLPDLVERAPALSAETLRVEVLQKCRQELIQQVQASLIYQEAHKELTDRISAAVDEYVDQELKDRINREFGGRQSRYEAYLAERGLTLEDARQREHRRLVIIKYLQDHVLPRVTDPTRRELLDYYEAHLDQFTEGGRRELFIIDLPKGSDAAKARADAEQAIRRLRDGEPFEEVARDLSQGIHAARGGRWGFVRGPLQGRYATASEHFFRMRSGQVSDLIEQDDGFFIVRAGEVVEPRTAGFGEVQADLRERYRNAQFDLHRSRILQELLARAIIEPDESLFLAEVVNTALERLQQVSSAGGGVLQ